MASRSECCARIAGPLYRLDPLLSACDRFLTRDRLTALRVLPSLPLSLSRGSVTWHVGVPAHPLSLSQQ